MGSCFSDYDDCEDHHNYYHHSNARYQQNLEHHHSPPPLNRCAIQPVHFQNSEGYYYPYYPQPPPTNPEFYRREPPTNPELYRRE